MRVLVLSSLFPSKATPNKGIFIKEQLSEIRNLCSIVSIISPVPWSMFGRQYKSNDMPFEEEWNGLKIYRPRYFFIPKLSVYLNGFSYFISVYKFLRRKSEPADFDLIHVHFAYPDGVAGALLGKVFGKRVVMTVRGTDINYFSQNPVLRAMIVLALRKVEAIVAVSDALRKKVLKMGISVNKITVIPNGVNLNLFKPLPKKDALESLGISDCQKIVLFVGAFEEVKGIPFLIKAFKEIIDSNIIDGAKLVLIGDGSLFNKINKMICDVGLNDYILLKQYVFHNEIVLWMNASDVFVLASLNEGRPNVLYEAMACGIPVVATDVGGVSEIITDKDLGELVPSGSVKDIKDALIRVLSKNWDVNLIRNYAMEHSMSDYSEKIVCVYRKLLNSSGDESHGVC